jgi:hypothetical protein
MKSFKYHQINQGYTNHAGKYDPNSLLNKLNEKLHLREDSELAKKLKFDEKLLAKIRERRLQISVSMLHLIQEATGINISELRMMLNDRRRELCPLYPHTNRRR